ncbi:MAG: hypothetical protein M3270_03005 [Thermoproteota archaeon]|nr:hypothetical protein [Thermoproteota archaeon]
MNHNRDKETMQFDKQGNLSGTYDYFNLKNGDDIEDALGPRRKKIGRDND